MNREIKFLCFDTLDKVMISSGHYFDECNILYSRYSKQFGSDTIGFLNVSDRYVMLEFTGIKDKKGNEIYEGQIYKSEYYTGIPGKFRRIIGVVKWHRCGFVLEGINKFEGLRVELNSWGEVIGNIYENSDFIVKDYK